MSGVYLTRLRLEQYRSFKDLDIRLPDGPGVLVVHGSNGIGKSSLFDGLEWALTDKIDHFRDADGVKNVGSYLCRWRDGAPGPTTVTMDFSRENFISRTLSSAEATKSITGGNIQDITEFLRDENWKRNISELSSYLLLTHFLGQSTISRLTNRDPGERFDILKEAAESKEIEDVANALHGKGNTRASRAYSNRIKSLNDEVVTLQSLLDAEASLWSGLTSAGALSDETSTQLAKSVSRLLDDIAGTKQPSPIVSFNQDTVSSLDSRLSEQRGRLRVLQAGVTEGSEALAAWESASRQVSEHHAAKATVDGQVALLANERQDAVISLETAKAGEIAAAAAAQSARRVHELRTGLRDALSVSASTNDRKEAADAALAAVRATNDREAATVASLERRLQIVRRIEGEVGRLDERRKLAQSEQQTVLQWLTRDARISEMRSAIQVLEARFPSLASDIEHAETVLRNSQELVDEQNNILTELRKTVSAMSGAVASVAANLTHDACDCPVCATHFEVKGELHRRAATAAERLAPFVLAQEERVQTAVRRWEAAATKLEQLRSAKSELTSAVQECESQVQANRELSVGAFGTDTVDRATAQARQHYLASSAEDMAKRRQRKWHWRNRLSGSFFAAGGEYASAVRRRDQAQVQMNTAIQEQLAIARELEAASVAVRDFDEVVGGLRDDELAKALSVSEAERVSAEAASERATSSRQAIEQQVSSVDVAVASASTRQQQTADQIASATQRKNEAAEAWRRLNFAQSQEPDALELRSWTASVNAMREKLREADDFLKQLRDGRAAKTLVDNHLAALERLRKAVNGAPNSDRLQLRNEAQDSIAEKSHLATATRKAKEIAHSASAEILNELAEFNTSYMQPLDSLMKSINRAILCDPRVGIELHVRNRRIEQSATKEGEVPADIGLIDPILVHSEGQMAALSVSMLCAASLTYPWSRWRGLVLDDPLQHNDAIHSAAFADFVCNLVASREYQVLLSTHDRAQAEFLRRKVASRNLPCAVLSLLGTGQEGVEWSYRPAASTMPAVASA